MKNLFNKVLFLFFLLSILNCINLNLFINKKYKNLDLSDKKLLIMPMPLNNIHIEIDQIVKKSYKKDSRSVSKIIQDTLYKYLNTIAQNNVTNITIIESKLPSDLLDEYQNSAFFPKTYRLGKDSIEFTFLIPKKELLYKYNIEADFILCLNTISFKKSSQYVYLKKKENQNSFNSNSLNLNVNGNISHFTPPNPQFQYHPTYSTQVFIESKIKFIIWDYSESLAIACGEVSAFTVIPTIPRKYTLMKHYENIVLKIFNRTPFQIIESEEPDIWEY